MQIQIEELIKLQFLSQQKQLGLYIPMIFWNALVYDLPQIKLYSIY